MPSAPSGFPPQTGPRRRNPALLIIGILTAVLVLIVGAGAIWFAVQRSAEQDLRPSENAYGEELTHLPVSSADRVRSGGMDETLTITFINSSDEQVRVDWIDNDGEHVPYNTLDPGQSYEQETRLSHGWLVSGDASGPLVLVIAGTNSGTVTIT